MFQAFLIKYGEIGIKGKNRYLFEDALVKQIRACTEARWKVNFQCLRRSRDVSLWRAEGLFDFEEAVEALQRVFGIVGICPVMKVDDKGLEELGQ